MGMINDRNSKDLTEAEEIKKRWQEYTEELYWITQIAMMAVGQSVWNQVGHRKHYMNKASGSDGIPADLFQILKDDAVKMLH